MFVDDVAILVKKSQLNQVLGCIKECGAYTGLNLNLSKTVIFDLNLTQVDVFPDVVVTNEPVKYLGAYLGLGSKVEQMNFDIIFSKMKAKISRWRYRVISLEARVLVIKTLIFSCCTHILNVTYILSKHLEQIKHLLNKFL